MTNTFTQYIYICAALIMTAALSSCHRPAAYFQPEPITRVTTVSTQPVALPVPKQANAPEIKASVTSPMPEAYAQNGNKLTNNKPLTKRMDRINTLLASIQKTEVTRVSDVRRNMNIVERLMIRKMNKKISQPLAPAKPEKTMVERIKLFGGILLLIVGVVIMLAGPNPILFLGIILALAGVVGIIAGLFGIG